jgi:hypothetical protein
MNSSRMMWHFAALLALAAFASGCGRPPGSAGSLSAAVPAVDSVTVSLWRFDEQSGVRCLDSGPARITATAGQATRTGFGRFGSAREFTRVLDSFVYAEQDEALNLPNEITIEAWLYIRSYGRFEDTPIVGRWTEEANQQSWLFSLVGKRSPGGPGYHSILVGAGVAGQLLFAFQPENGAARTFLSSQQIPIGRWTHVAVSYDGQVVRFFVEGGLDAQYAVHERIHASDAPLLMGSYINTRRLSDFSGELMMDVGVNDQPFYGYDGFIDELRISNAARTNFPGSAGH